MIAQPCNYAENLRTSFTLMITYGRRNAVINVFQNYSMMQRKCSSMTQYPISNRCTNHRILYSMLYKSKSEWLKLVVPRIAFQPENVKCIDCKQGSTFGRFFNLCKGSAFASVNLGVFVCTNCAYYHRRYLGVHISRLKAIIFDSFSPSEVKVHI